MRTIYGYVIWAKVEYPKNEDYNLRYRYPLFGPLANGEICSIEGNGLEVWVSLEVAEQFIETIRSKFREVEKLEDISLAHLHLDIAESHQESKELRNSNYLAILSQYSDVNSSNDYRLWGEVMKRKGRPFMHFGTLQTSQMKFNNYRGIKDFDRAVYIRSEIQRQTDNSPTLIAGFKLNKIKQ